jgi:hypothetical protein
VAPRDRFLDFTPDVEWHMGIEIGDLIVGLLVIAFSLIGLFLAAGVYGNEMYIFGLALAGWGAVLVFSLLRRHVHRRAIARLAVRGEKPQG